MKNHRSIVCRNLVTLSGHTQYPFLSTTNAIVDKRCQESRCSYRSYYKAINSPGSFYYLDWIGWYFQVRRSFPLFTSASQNLCSEIKTRSIVHYLFGFCTVSSPILSSTLQLWSQGICTRFLRSFLAICQ